MMTKAQLEKALSEECEKNLRLATINDMAIDELNDLAVGFGRKRNKEWSASYLAADILADIARQSNR